MCETVHAVLLPTSSGGYHDLMKSSLRRSALLTLSLLAACSAPDAPPQHYAMTPGAAAAAQRRAVHAVTDLKPDTAFATEVRAAFVEAWNGYVRHAWGHDALKPLSGSWRDWYDHTLLMTPVDAYDTMRLMGLTAQADSARALILADLDFDQDMVVQVFEVNIRILGGLLSAYQLEGDPRFLDLAAELGDRMMPAFDSPTGMPYVRVNLGTGAVTDPHNNPAEIGTLMLEFGQLSRITGDPKYYDAAKKAITEVFDRRSPLDLVGTIINVETGEWENTGSHIGGRIDSYYEYLLKAWLLFGDEDFKHMWEVSLPAVETHVADSVDGHAWYGRVDMNTGERLQTRFGALEAFWPAVLALGGDLERAAKVQESIQLMFTTFGVEPETFDYSTMEIGYPSYPLRPEAVESAYYLFVLTGDERWRTMGEDFVRRILDAAQVEGGFAHLSDVRTGEHDDAMESFFLAETLKYAWLLARPEVLNFDGVVFNTEAHPLIPLG